MARGHALQRIGDEVARASLRLRARLFLELAHPPGELVAHEILGALEQRELRLVDGHAGDALEFGDLLVTRQLLLLLELAQMGLPVGEPLLSSGELGQLSLDLLLLREDAFLDLDDPGPVVGNLLVDLRAEAYRLLAGADLGLAAKRLRLPGRVFEHEPALLLGGAQTGLAKRPEGHGARRSTDDQSDQNPDCEQHGQLLGRLAAALPRCPPRRSAGMDVPKSG